MKRILAPFIALIAVLFSACVSDAPDVLSPLASIPDNTIVRVSGGALKLAMMAVPSNAGFVKKIKSVEVFTCEDSGQSDAIADASRRIAESRGMELLLEQRDSTDTVHIYGLESEKKAGEVKEILIQVAEPGETTVVFIKGKIDIASILENSSEIGKILKD